MDFLYLFGLVDFDEQGNVCESSRENYLYLVSKYNQIILHEEKLPITDFFKTQLLDVLQMAKSDYEGAKNRVIKNCHLKVQTLVCLCKTEREFILKLNESISARDEAFADYVGKNINHLQLAYIITSLSGKIEKKIEKAIYFGLEDKMLKSKTYKDIIKYNRLMLTAQKVGNGELVAADLCPVVVA